ncbi:MAG TPA: NAD-dependent epimerase/dehydratase family protein [Flavobacterium sp.]|jgi:nucleoside-diphosphate-sugar epimerase
MVLVTGATGLVGSHLTLHLLEHGETVRAIYRNPLSTDYTKKIFALYEKESLYEQIQWIQADITDVPTLGKAFENITEVYHCAAFISFSRKDEEQLRKVNIEGTANIVNLCIDFKIRKICFVSSIAALGDLKHHEKTITEEAEWNPEKHHSDYAISKYGAEMEIWRGQQEGIQTVIVNPGVILGPSPKGNGKSQGSAEIFTAIQNELPFYTKGSTGFVAVSDVVGIMFKLMKSNIAAERFTLVEGNYKFRFLANTIANILRVRRPWIHAKPWMTSLAWKIDWLLGTLIGKRRLLFKDMATSLHSKEKFANEKIRTTLQHDFEPINAYINKVIELQKRLT